MQAFKSTMSGCTKEAKQNAVALAKGTMTLEQAKYATQQFSLSAKVGQIAMKGLASAGNMVVNAFAMWAITKGIECLSNWINRAEHAKETAREFTNSINEMHKNQQSNTKTIAELNDEYKKLSSGVNGLGDNVSLTADEYNRYHEITNQVADLIPNLVRGWDAQGNAILKVKGKLADLNKEYKKQKQMEAIELYYTTNKDAYNDTGKVFKENSIASNLFNYDLSGTDSRYEFSEREGSSSKVLSIMSKLADDSMSYKQYKKKIRNLPADASDYNDEDTALFLADNIIKDDIGDINIQNEEEFSKYKKRAQELYKVKSNDLKAYASQVSTGILGYASTTDDYRDSDYQSEINSIFSNMSYDLITSQNLDNEDNMKVFVNNTIHAINENKNGISTALSELFSLDLDTSNLAPKELQSQINTSIQAIASTLGIEDINALKLSLGFDVDYTNLQKQYDKAINDATENLVGADKNNLEKFFKDNSINTQEEINKWNEIAKNCKTAENAKKKYLNWSISSSSNPSTNKVAIQKLEIEELTKEYQEAVSQPDNKTDTSSINKISDKLENAKTKLNKIKQSNFISEWSALDTTDNDELKNTKKNLTDLADAGKLTVDAFNKTEGSSVWAKRIGLSAEEATKKINELTSSSKQLSNLKSAVVSIQDAYSEKEENKVVGSDTLVQMEAEFGSLGKAWDKYKQVAGSTKTSTADLKKAQNELATAYINSNNFLSGLVDETGKCTDANKQYYISQLEELGIKNAEKIVNDAIIQQKAALALQSFDSANATDAEITALAAENNALGESNNAYTNYIFYKALANKTALSTSGSVRNLIELANRCGITGKAVSNLQQLLTNLDIIEQNNKDINNSTVTDSEKNKKIAENKKLKKKNKKLKKAIDNPYADTGITVPGINIPSNPNGSGGNKGTSKSMQEIDWIDRRITTLTSKISLLNSQKENLFNVKKKSNNLKEQITQTTKLIKTYSAAYKEYMNKANAVDLSSSLKQKVQNGQITGNHNELIKEYGGTTAEQIESYKKYYDQAQSAKKNLAEAKTSKHQLRIERLQNYVNNFDAKAEYNQLRADNISRSIKKRNTAIDNKITNVKKSYSKQIKIAGINHDSTEKKRLKEERKQTVRDLKIQKNQNYVDKFEARANYNNLMASNTSRTAKERNSYLEKEKTNLKKSYNYQIKIAKLNKDTTEQKRLQEEYQQKLVELSKQEFDNIANEYEKKIQVLGYNISQYDNKIEEIEASGATVNRSYYDSKKTVNNQILAQYKAEQAALEKKLPSIKKGTDEYYDALDAIQACKDGISGCIQTTYELNNAINDLQFNQFDKIAEKISRIIDEQDFLQNLFSHEKITDEKTGNFTDAGLAKLGSVSTNYYAAKEKAANSSELLETLKDVKNRGKQANGTYKLGYWEFNSLEVLEAKIDETYDTWRDNLKETYEYESEIADMMKDKYQAELDLLQDLIDAKKEALQAEKDLHDYQRTITEKTKDISTIQKQIAAYSGDTSQEGLAKLQKLQKELAEKEEDLRETEYEKYISDQEEMLNKLYEEYEELVTKKLNDFYELVDKGLATANSNTSIIASYIKEVAKNNGYTIENDGVVKDGDIQNNVGNAVTNIENNETSNNQTSSSHSNSTSSGGTPSGYYSPIISDSNGIIYDRNKKKDMKEYAIRFIKKNATPAKKAYHQYADLNRAIYTNSKNVFGFGDKKKILKIEKMKELALDMGFIYDNSTKSGALYQKLLAVGIPGFKHGGIGELIKAQGEDGIAFVRNGEGFISPENVPAMKELVNNVPLINELTQSLIKSPNLSGITPFNNVGNNIEANYNFTLENCNNAEDIIYQIQTSAKIQKAIQSVSVDRIAGGGRLGVHSIK